MNKVLSLLAAALLCLAVAGVDSAFAADPCLPSYQQCVMMCAGNGACVNNCNIGYSACQQQRGGAPAPGQGGMMQGGQGGMMQGGQGGMRQGGQGGMAPGGQGGMMQAPGGAGNDPCFASYQQCAMMCAGNGACVTNCNNAYAVCQSRSGRRP